jgi:HPt (histidine-containing phosphotransfer) domain-containing protein
LRRSAHTLKGALRTLAIESAGTAAADLEEMGRQDRLSESRTALARLESELDAILPEARAFACAPAKR